MCLFMVLALDDTKRVMSFLLFTSAVIDEEMMWLFSVVGISALSFFQCFDTNGWLKNTSGA